MHYLKSAASNYATASGFYLISDANKVFAVMFKLVN